MKVNRPAPRSEQPTQEPRHALRTGSEGDPKTGPSTRDQQGPSKPSKPSKMPMLWPSLGGHSCNLLFAPAPRGFLV